MSKRIITTDVADILQLVDNASDVDDDQLNDNCDKIQDSNDLNAAIKIFPMMKTHSVVTGIQKLTFGDCLERY